MKPHTPFNEKITKGLIDIIVLQHLSLQPMHGYQIMAEIRQNYGVQMSPSIMYLLLNTLEKQKLIIGEWDINSEHSRKIYKITGKGQKLLNQIKESLNLTCKKLITETEQRQF
ncbi:MAG: PadR family transcriptional regulator [Candidatus Bathyarchaeia archaeon]